MLAPSIETSTTQPTERGRDVCAQIDQLKEQFAAQQAQSQQRIEELERTNKLLREQVDAVLRRFFGSRTKDSIDPAQLEMAMKGLDVPEALSTPVTPPLVATSAKRRGKAKRRPLPDNLPTETIVIDPAEVLASPEDWKQVGEERSEELDWVPGKFIKRIYLRRKYTPKETSDGIVIAPMPKRAIDKGLPGPGLLAQIMISKYVDHQPLERQLKMFARRYGVTLSRQTMVDWVGAVAAWLKILYDLLKGQLLDGNYLQVDETPVRYLDRKVKGKCKKGYLWVFSDPKGAVLFDWNTSRSHEVPLTFIGDFCGALQCDAYGAYKTLATKREKLVIVGCWAHVYRKFREALPHAPVQAGWFMRQIQLLYANEKHLREQGASSKERARFRQAYSRPVLARIKRAVELMQSRIDRRKILPKSLLGKAVSYTYNQWASLEGYVDRGEVEIDNNQVERAIRPAAIGRKNFLFFGAEAGGSRSAILYSIVETCQRLEINPQEYLTDILHRMPAMDRDDYPSLLPANWKAQHQRQLQS